MTGVRKIRGGGGGGDGGGNSEKQLNFFSVVLFGPCTKQTNKRKKN